MNVVAHNMLAMNASRQIGITERKRAKKTEKLSSGYKISRAADDCAGLAISEKMRRQIRGLSRAVVNAQDGISMVQIADGAMAEVDELLHRGTQLAIQSANGTLTDIDREYLQAEIDQIKKEINRISDSTTFNEIQVLKGADVEERINPGNAALLGGLPDWVAIDAASASSLHLSSEVITEYTIPYSYVDAAGDTQTGNVTFEVPHVGSTLDFSALDGLTGTELQEKISELTAENTGFYTTCCTCNNHYSVKFNDGGGNFRSSSGNHVIYNVDVSGVTSGEDVVDRILGYAGNCPNDHYTNFQKSKSNSSVLEVYDNRAKVDSPNTIVKQKLIEEVGVFDFSFNFKGLTPKLSNATAHATNSMGFFGPGVAYSADDMATEIPATIKLQIGSEKGDTMEIILPSISTGALKLKGVDISTQSGASSSIDAFKGAVEYVSKERSRMGAYQNRLEHTINNLSNVVENTQAAESQLRDADMASEMVAFANLNIIEQAGNAMLTQANQLQENVLSLLK